MTINEAVERAKAEILRDVKRRRVPSRCRSFAELHDYVDANGYGGAFEEEPRTPDVDFWNHVHDELDIWIKAGGLRLQ